VLLACTTFCCCGCRIVTKCARDPHQPVFHRAPGGADPRNQGQPSLSLLCLVAASPWRIQDDSVEKSRRQILYADFIEEASKCNIDAFQHGEGDIPGLIGLYAKLSRMRALSSAPVVQRADEVARKILDTYLEPDRSFVELRKMAIDGTIDLLQGFSAACRHEFDEMP
jgi:hypothetical protein